MKYYILSYGRLHVQHICKQSVAFQFVGIIEKSVDKSLQTLHLCFLGVPLAGVNPFEYVTELYDEAMLEKYRTITPDEIKVREGILSQFWN